MTGPISTKLGTKLVGMKEFKVIQMKGHNSCSRGDYNEIVKIH